MGCLNRARECFYWPGMTRDIRNHVSTCEASEARHDIVTIMYKVNNNLAPPHIAGLFVVKTSRYTVRNSEFVLPRFRTVAYGKHSISYLGPLILSKLNHFVIPSESVCIFKKRIKSTDLSQLIDNTCRDCFLCNN